MQSILQQDRGAIDLFVPWSIKAGASLGSEMWERYMASMNYGQWHLDALFCRRPARLLSLAISKVRPALQWHKDVSMESISVPRSANEHHVIAIVVELKSWPWSFVIGCYGSHYGFRDDVSTLARDLLPLIGSDLVALFENTSLEVGATKEPVFELHEHDWEYGLGPSQSEWLAERGIFVPPIHCHVVSGHLTVAIAGIPLSEVARVDVLTNFEE